MQPTLPIETPGSEVKEPRDAGLMLYLTGRPSLKSFLRFVESNAIEPPDEGALIEEWQAAQELVRGLETTEAGIADAPQPPPDLGDEYEELLVEFLKDPIQKASFNTVPTQIALVELDKLVVYQKHIDVTHSGTLKAALGSAPSREQVFETCLPYNHPRPPIQWSKSNSKTYVFSSPSNDLRFLGVKRLDSSQIVGSPANGDSVACVAADVGFGSNFLNAFYVEGRLILHNGSHRAYTLKEIGVTHVPCLVQHVNAREVLEVVAPEAVTGNLDLYLKSARPPMLRDYLNPALRKLYRFRRRLQQITVKIEVTEAEVPMV